METERATEESDRLGKGLWLGTEHRAEFVAFRRPLSCRPATLPFGPRSGIPGAHVGAGLRPSYSASGVTAFGPVASSFGGEQQQSVCIYEHVLDAYDRASEQLMIKVPRAQVAGSATPVRANSGSVADATRKRAILAFTPYWVNALTLNLDLVPCIPITSNVRKVMYLPNQRGPSSDWHLCFPQ